MANINNPAALLRSLIVYAVCVPLAIVVGYLLTDIDYQSLGVVAVVAAILIFPLLMKWHYPLLVFSCGLPAVLFFLPGRPSLFLVMVVLSLTISVLERILNRNQPFLTPSAVAWPLIALLGVLILTAKLTGGFGLRSFGSEVYGGKKYIYLFIGILSFFAFSARPIPRRYAKWYITLYFIGGIFSVIQDLYPFVPPSLRFIFAVFPPNSTTMGAEAGEGQNWELGVTRLAGIRRCEYGAIFYWMLARNGLRDNFFTGKIWRPVLLGLMFILVFLGGFRASIIGLMIIVGLLFYLEKMYRTGLMLVVTLLGLMGAALVIPMAPHLPYTFQRALAFLPLDISPQARMDAEGSTDWRLEMWSALLPQVPQYLLLGKGYAFSAETFNESMGSNATFGHVIDASQDPLALSSDFHNGPLSVVIPFGIWGALGWLWYLAAGYWVVWRNYKYGDPGLRQINIFFFAFFICKVFGFLFIFGAFPEDVGNFGGLIGLSIAFNHGVMGPRPVPKANPAFARPRMDFPARPALQR